jgi:uncharacterized membrane protein
MIMSNDSTLFRAFFKSSTWKIIGVLTLIIVSIAAGVSPIQIGKITFAYHVITWVLYIMHERAWNRVTWGKRR